MSTKADLELSFKSPSPIISQSDNALTMRAFDGSPMEFKVLSPGLLETVNKLMEGGHGESELSSLVFTSHGQQGMFAFMQYMKLFHKQNLLCYTLRVGETPFCTLVPASRYFSFKPRLSRPESRYSLSRFAYCHQVDGKMILESSLGYAHLVLHDWRANAALAHLSQPHNRQELAEIIGDISEDEVGLLLELLLNGQAICEVDGENQSAETTEEKLAQWEFHDLLFHSRSRQGRHDRPFGAGFPYVGKFKPLPAIKSPMSAEAIPLYKPDLEVLKQNDPTFTTVLEKRRSVRELGEEPVTSEQLGEFLYRVARVKQRFTGGYDVEMSLRPYPGGGAEYELEIYPVINKCEGLASAVYQYDPLEHQLYKIADRSPALEKLFYMAWFMVDKRSQPQVYFGITARFQRVQFKYQSLAYALVLKDVGVLFQTMYLAATAMGLAPCGLGSGDSDFFAAVTGTDYYAESLVGEFLLGSRGNG